MLKEGQVPYKSPQEEGDFYRYATIDVQTDFCHNRIVKQLLSFALGYLYRKFIFVNFLNKFFDTNFNTKYN